MLMLILLFSSIKIDSGVKLAHLVASAQNVSKHNFMCMDGL